MTPRFLEPYIITAVISVTAYKLNLPAALKIHPVFHISLLKKYKETEDFERTTPPAPIILSDNTKEYEVETILDKKNIRNRN